MKVAGRQISLPFEFPSLNLKLTRHGVVLSARSGLGPVGAGGTPKAAQPDDVTGISGHSLNLCQFFGQMSTLRFPKWEPRVGSAWSQVSRLTSPTGETTNISARSVWKRSVEVKGEACAEIETTAVFPMHAETDFVNSRMRIDGTYNLRTTYCFALTAGRLVDLRGNAQVVQTIRLTPPGAQSSQGTATEILAKSDVEFSMELQ
jgi:hypothetical protein